MFNIQDFPADVSVTHLQQQHPYILENLRLLWGYPEGTRYLADLIMDVRGDRAGFSPEVMDELLALSNQPENPGAILDGFRGVPQWETARLGG